MTYLTMLLVTLFMPLTPEHDSEYKEKTQQDGVIVYYKWDHKDSKNESSPLQLVLKIKNNNKQAVSLSFGVEYYMTGVMQEGLELEDFCIKSRGTANGRMNGIVLNVSTLTNKDIMSDGFTWELTDLKVEKKDKCPK